MFKQLYRCILIWVVDIIVLRIKHFFFINRRFSTLCHCGKLYYSKVFPIRRSLLIAWVLLFISYQYYQNSYLTLSIGHNHLYTKWKSKAIAFHPNTWPNSELKCRSRARPFDTKASNLHVGGRLRDISHSSHWRCVYEKLPLCGPDAMTPVDGTFFVVFFFWNVFLCLSMMSLWPVLCCNKWLAG